MSDRINALATLVPERFCQPIRGTTVRVYAGYQSVIS
ncbi:flagellar assembly FliH domain protein [Yersinia pestis 14735]|nr:flagellar assembly FliH domain protein [Yersinia pestis 14735]